jgi:hypothetical protein
MEYDDEGEDYATERIDEAIKAKKDSITQRKKKV